MPPKSWSSPSVLLVSTPPRPDVAALRASTADAIVLYATEDAISLRDILAARPDLPLIVLADVSEADAVELIGQGADDVLPSAATMPQIAKSARHSMARRSRRERATAQSVARTFPNAPQLQAIARLAGGIAHEFNNLLTVVEANVDHLQQALTDEPTRQSAEAIGIATRRAASLTRQLLAFGRQQTLITAAVDVNDIVADAAPVLRNAMGKHVRVVTELASDLPQVRVDAEQMTEVLSNLAATALEAMPHGGTFTIASDSYVVSDEERRNRPWLPSGKFVRLLVSDTGLGIEEQALPHLFEPFYSANGALRGTGLTMSSVYGVVKQSGGFIWVDSHVNQGTRVTILLPPLEASNGPATRAEKLHRAPSRILLVEDTDAVRETLTSILEMHGFSVTPACTAEEASEFARTLRFDLLLTDVALPGRSGPELARDFREMFPATPILFMSGHSANTMDPRDLDSPRSFLQKPFSGQTLVARIREMLGQPAQAPES
jgi:two-component system, cell cycle sensor histidine kinase and response regulator CckA